MISAFSLWPIPFYQDNYSFQFEAVDNSRCLSFPVFPFLALFFVLFFIPLQLIEVENAKVLTPSRHECLETMKFEYIFCFIIVSLSDASRSSVMLLFILRLKDKESTLTAFCCYKNSLRNF